MLNVKSKRAVLGIAACVAVVALTFAGLAVSTTSGAGTDDDTEPAATLTSVPAATATPAASTPPQAPVEPPTGAADANAGDQAGAGTLPSAGYGDAGNGNAMLFLVLAGSILAAGTALTIAGRMPRSRKQ